MPENLSLQPPVFRFAPSPNGLLHLGHALSTLINRDMAAKSGGRLLLRLEDIDITRCRPEYEQAIFDDLNWLEFHYEKPVRKQSEHTADYQAALDTLASMDLIYPGFMSRGEIKAFVSDYEADGKVWPRDPDGAPFYPHIDRQRPESERKEKLAAGEKHVWRLDMAKAKALCPEPQEFEETGPQHAGILKMDPAIWGDVMLWRSDAPSSYHLSVTVDDALQGVTHIVRGLDLFAATPLHRLLQTLLDLPAPIYHHHRLILDENGRKLSKSSKDTALTTLRAEGATLTDIERLTGFA